MRGKNKYGLICLLLTTVVGTSVGHPGAVAAEPFVQQAKLSDLDGVVTQFADYQGISVSVDGNTAVVGASGDENNRGSAYVFVYVGETWNEEVKLTASDGEAYDGFGQSVFVSGRTIVVSAPRDRDNGRGSGSAYVYRVPLLERADVDGNGVIDLPDFLAFAEAFGTTDFRLDFDEDGTVEFSDFLTFVGLYGQSA